MSDKAPATCDLCDAHKGDTDGAFRVLPPVFRDFGGRTRLPRAGEHGQVLRGQLDGQGRGRIARPGPGAGGRRRRLAAPRAARRQPGRRRGEERLGRAGHRRLRARPGRAGRLRRRHPRAGADAAAHRARRARASATWCCRSAASGCAPATGSMPMPTASCCCRSRPDAMKAVAEWEVVPSTPEQIEAVAARVPQHGVAPRAAGRRRGGGADPRAGLGHQRGRAGQGAARHQPQVRPQRRAGGAPGARPPAGGVQGHHRRRHACWWAASSRASW